MKKDDINIAFICDANYVLCTGVALMSLKTHRVSDRNYNIYIVYDGIKNCDIEKFEFLSDNNFSVICINAKEKIKAVKFDKKPFVKHVSVTATYKFYLPILFPNIKKLLYLDGDLIIRDGLDKIYDTDISNEFVAACKDMGAETLPANFRTRLRINHKFYFNSGVMLLNLEKMRSDNIVNKFIEYRKKGINDYMDQDTFNVVFSEHVKYLNIRYNMATSCWAKYDLADINAYYDEQFSSKVSCYTEALILHLTTSEKPWIYSDVIGSEEWLYYFKISPFYSFSFSRRLIIDSQYKKAIESEKEYYIWIKEQMAPQDLSEVNKPDISVIVPVFNGEMYLPECIESLLDQTYHNAEFIFIDDSSTDASAELIEVYSIIDNRVKLTKQKHGGAGLARNMGLSKALGKYVTFLDCDDVFLPNALEVLYRKIQSTSTQIVVCGCRAFSTDKTITRDYNSSLKKEHLPTESVFSVHNFSQYLFQFTDGQPWGKMFDMNFIRTNRIEFPQLARSEDIPFTCMALSLADGISIIDDNLILHRIIEGSNSLEESKDNHPDAVVDALRTLWERLETNNIEDKLYVTMINKIVITLYHNFKTMRTESGLRTLYEMYKTFISESFDDFFNDITLFYDQSKAQYLKMVYESNSFENYLYRSYYEAKEENKYLRQQIDMLYDSKSYLVSRILTWFPRKIRGGIQCYKDNGFKYTVIRVKQHLLREVEEVEA